MSEFKKHPNIPNAAVNYSINKNNKRYGGNAILSGPGVMPAKYYPSVGSNMFSIARQVWKKDAGGGVNTFQSSDYTQMKRLNAIGKSSNPSAPPANNSFSTQDTVNRNVVNHQRKFVRSGGSVAPAKKGFVSN